ncbi:insulinase family protein [Sandaracinobacter sp. RS1-74]|uniref:M16 family metallopeptidase n=1 Tax=Sandaracinobacteroides sayramensis TaxID=2913411 RepID=UPI001EDBBBF2|nr:pitrilysin family protein [Sandaracinobacteroides sayramensis]MCG2841908.1 insulinase family protein [Sandaracinobacteroides sayramensis]
MIRTIAVALAAALMSSTALSADPAPLAELVKQVDIPYEQFTLANGLKVVVHTDRKAPLVHVGVWYHVGSVDEPVGRSGFAHLFEHLMFYGSEHHAGDHFKPLEAIGATDFNGTTSYDRTNYFQTVPTPALDLALFLESDRMGFLLPALTQEKLDAQRKVVLNEKRQGDNSPGGLTQYELLKQLFPADHPMSVSTIGKPEDLNAATLDDARGWFRNNYGPNNAVLVLAGDIDAATAKPLVEKWFGEIPAGPTPGRFAGWVPIRSETTRATMTDKVATSRVSRYWAVPGRGEAADIADLQVALAILAGGSTSRLHEALVRDERLAVAVGGGVSPQGLAGIASLSAEAAPGVDPAKLEARIDALLAEFLKHGPTADEVDRVAMRAVSGTIRGLEKVGGFGGKGVALAEGLLYADNPGDYRDDLLNYAAATPGSVRRAAEKWLTPGDFRLTLLPGERSPKEVALPPSVRLPASLPAAAAKAETGPPADRSKGLPEAGPATSFNLPAVERAKLSNGMELVFARTTAVPVVRVMLSVPGGVPSDSRAKPGTQTMMLGLLDEGTEGALGPMDGPAIARLSERLGLGVGASASLDRTRFTLNALTPNLAESVALFADVVRHPTFPADQLERVRVQALTQLKREETNPGSLAIRALPPLLYGPGHPYGSSFSGSGTEAGLKAVTRDDLIAFHRASLNPAQAQIFVVGDTDMATLKPLMEAAFGDWQSEGAAAPVLVPPPAPQAAGRIVFIDRPGAEQSVILAAAPSRLTGRDDMLALSLANDIFGGLASARLNQELREKRNWSYGAYSSLSPTRESMPFLLSAPVETEATGRSIAAIRQLLDDFHGKAPPTEDEIGRARANVIRSLPGDFETGGALLAALERGANLDRPDDYLETLPKRLAAVPDRAVAGAPLPKAGELVWIVVGDKASVLPQLQKLGMPVEERPAG